MDIEQREFVRHFSKYLKQTGTFSVHGRDNYEVIIHRLSDKSVKKDAFNFNDVATISPRSKIDQEESKNIEDILNLAHNKGYSVKSVIRYSDGHLFNFVDGAP